MPLSGVRISTNPDDGVSARAFALAVIIFLTFAVRGDVGTSLVSGKVALTTLVGGVAGLISFLLNKAVNILNLQQRFHVRLRERWLISAYTSLIGVMFFFVFYQTLFTGFDLYEMWTQVLGSTVTPIFMAMVTTFVILFVKARFIDQHAISGFAAVHGAGVILCCGLITFAVSLVSNEGFNWLVNLASKK